MKILKSIIRMPFAMLVCTVFAFNITTLNAQEARPDLPAHKQTTLGLYVTSAEAYLKWNASQENIKILDVRTPEEYIFIGHASMAYNVPLALQTNNWDSTTNEFAMQPVVDFVSQVKKVAKRTDTLFVTCRSGGRSAMATNLLAKEGFLFVYNITDGFEGDMVKDETSLYYEKRMKNGWKNSGLPWTYELHPDQMITPTKD